MKNTLPMIYQNDSMECGLAALAMILQFYSYGAHLSELREKHPPDLSGLSIGALVNIAKEYQLACHVLRLEAHEMDKLKLPAILHWNLNHFVVLKKIKARSLIIHDPSRGVYAVTKKLFSENFSGIALECYPEKTFKRKEKPKIKMPAFVRSMLYLTSIKSLIFKIALFTMLYQVFLLIIPRYLRVVIDQVIPATNHSLLIMTTFGFLGLRVLSTLAKACKLFCIHQLDKELSFSLSNLFGEHVMQLPIAYFEKHYLGDIISRFNSIEQLRQIFSNGLIEGVLGGLLAIMTGLVMLYVSLPLAGITIGVSLVYLLLRFKLIHYYKMNTGEMIRTKSHEQVCFLENIRGIQPIKIFAKERERFELWRSRNRLFLHAAHKNNLLKSLAEYSKELFMGVEIVAVIFVAVSSLMQHQFSIGLLYSYLFYRQQFTDSLMVFAEKISELKLVPLYRDRLEGLMVAKKEDLPREIAKFHSPLTVAVRQLSFRYSPHGPVIFSNLNLTVAAGEIVALVGPSGMGKTTLLKVMMGLQAPSSGTLSYNGIPFDRKVFASAIASVMQDDCLLSGTIAENIAFFAKQPDFKKIIACARLAGVLEEIFRMPMKLNTLVGDMGMTLSGGQKQRVLLARAFYANPQILFLDEATSHLDVQKEREINNSIKSLGLTTIMVAHRPETIRMADRVIELTS